MESVGVPIAALASRCAAQGVTWAAIGVTWAAIVTPRASNGGTKGGNR